MARFLGVVGGRPLPKLVEGESYVFLFRRNEKVDHGPEKYWFNRQSVFRDMGAGYTNGEVFREKPVSLSTLRAKVMKLYRAVKAGDGCPFDVLPDRSQVDEDDRDAGGTRDVQLGKGYPDSK